MYLELVYNNHEVSAVAFMKKFGPEQEDYYQDDLRRLAHVTKRDQMKDNELTDTFK
jgi:transcription initiation factor TFIID subunit 5